MTQPIATAPHTGVARRSSHGGRAALLNGVSLLVLGLGVTAPSHQAMALVINSGSSVGQ